MRTITNSMAAKLLGLAAISVALFALGGVAPGQSGATPSPRLSSNTQTPKQGTPAWPKDRYLAFSNSIVLPAIAAVDNTAIRLGQWGPMQVGRQPGKPTLDRKLTAMQLGVPVGVVDRLLERFAQNPQIQVADLARELRAATIDFRFLLAEMTAYNPPAEGQQPKTDGLQALLRGDLQKAWDSYLSLPWPAAPAPPKNLRVVATGN